jgi:DNA-binding FadR family transcriptional regulator
MPLKPLNSERLVEQAVGSLRELVLSGRYAEGGELPSQGELCDELGVSRSVIREAMRTLQSEGLVEVSQGRRPRVSPARPNAVIRSLETLVHRTEITLLQVVEIRRLLEAETAAHAARVRDPALLDGLDRAARDLAEARDLEAQIEADKRFHTLLAQASGNPLYGIVLDALAHLLYDSRRLTLHAGGAEVPAAAHGAIVEAIRRGDPKEAAAAMLRHLDRTGADITRLTAEANRTAAN